MKVFRVISIVCTIAFIIFAIVGLKVEVTVQIRSALAIGGIVIAILNIISIIMCWLIDAANERNSWQLSWYNRLWK